MFLAQQGSQLQLKSVSNNKSRMHLMPAYSLIEDPWTSLFGSRFLQDTSLWCLNAPFHMKLAPHFLHWQRSALKWMAYTCFLRLVFRLLSFPHIKHSHTGNLTPSGLSITFSLITLLASSSRVALSRVLQSNPLALSSQFTYKTEKLGLLSK